MSEYSKIDWEICYTFTIEGNAGKKFFSSKYSGPKVVHHSNLSSSLYLTTVDWSRNVQKFDSGHFLIKSKPWFSIESDYTDVKFFGHCILDEKLKLPLPFFKPEKVSCNVDVEINIQLLSFITKNTAYWYFIHDSPFLYNRLGNSFPQID